MHFNIWKIFEAGMVLFIYEFSDKSIFGIAIKLFFLLLYYHVVSRASHVNCFSHLLLSAPSKIAFSLKDKKKN